MKNNNKFVDAEKVAEKATGNEEIIRRIYTLYKKRCNTKNFVLDTNLFEQKEFIEESKTICYKFFEKYIEKEINNAKLQVHFVNDNKLNALAFYLENNPIICINIGCLLNIQHYSSLLTTDKEFFPEIGNLLKCTKTVKLSECFPPKIKVTKSGLYKIYIYNGIDDKSRRRVASLITIFAHSFLLFHELGHHIYGHTKYLEKVYGVSYLKAAENKNENVNDVECLTIQCMETHADAFAVRQLLQIVVPQVDAFFDFEIFVESNNKFKLMLEILISSLCLVSILMEEDGINETNFKTEYYLPQRLRLDLMLRYFKSYLINDYDNEFSEYCNKMEDITDTIARIYQKLRTIIFQIREEPDDNADERFLFDDAINEYYRNDILKHWNKIKKELIPYAIVEEV